MRSPNEKKNIKRDTQNRKETKEKKKKGYSNKRGQKKRPFAGGGRVGRRSQTCPRCRRPPCRRASARTPKTWLPPFSLSQLAENFGSSQKYTEESLRRHQETGAVQNKLFRLPQKYIHIYVLIQSFPCETGCCRG